MHPAKGLAPSKIRGTSSLPRGAMCQSLGKTTSQPDGMQIVSKISKPFCELMLPLLAEATSTGGERGTAKSTGGKCHLPKQ
jgi:hypothetical protein